MPPALVYFMPSSLPSLFLRPCLVVGIPVAFATFLFAEVIPKARFQLKDRPGMPAFFFAIPLTLSAIRWQYHTAANAENQ